MMANIERALNAIWEVGKRGFASKFLIYWAVLSLGPILIGASVLATSTSWFAAAAGPRRPVPGWADCSGSRRWSPRRSRSR